MTVHSTICLLLSCLALSLVLCEEARQTPAGLTPVPGNSTTKKHVPVETGAPYARCEKRHCVPGSSVLGESMEGHFNSDTVILSAADLSRNISVHSGIILTWLPEEKLPELRSGILTDFISRSRYSPKVFVRSILSPDGSYSMGWLVVERPVPDPDKRFDILAQDPLLAGVQTDLRPQVDIASLIPTSIKGCESSRCVQVIPVSIGSCPHDVTF